MDHLKTIESFLSVVRTDSVVADGVLAEWEGVPTMAVDERTPIVRYANSD